MQPNEKRILNALKKAKGKGVIELDLVGDKIKDSYARKIMSCMNKYLGKGAIYRELGVWYLAQEYWDISPVDVRENILWNEIKGMRNIIKWTIPITLGSLIISAILLTSIILI